jgi:hypothetical protein
MGASNWTAVPGSAVPPNVAVGTSGALGVPNGGGSFVFGFNALVGGGCAALRLTQASFAPTARGAIVSAAIRRIAGPDPAGSSVMLFASLGSDAVSAVGYLLGIGAGGRLTLRKGRLDEGLPDVPVGASGVLARGTEVVPVDAWRHLRLEVVVNVSGDSVINCYQSDLGAHPVTAPTWLPIPGMPPHPAGVPGTAFLDDTLGIASGSLPIGPGRVGIGFCFTKPAQGAAVDHFHAAKQN